jgi:hypothetical protein
MDDTSQNLRPWVIFAGCVLVVVVLYWVQAVLVPIAVAVLLTFVLTPPVSWLERWLGRVPAVLTTVTLVFIVLGLAGSAAVALLVLSTIPSTRWAIAYLAVFGIGTILGMTLITMTLGSTFAFGQRRWTRIGHHFGWAAGVISLGFGLFIAYQTGFVDGQATRR